MAVADRPLVPIEMMSCVPAVWPNHNWYEVAPVSCDQVNVTVLPGNVDPFGGEVICPVTGVTVKVPPHEGEGIVGRRERALRRTDRVAAGGRVLRGRRRQTRASTQHSHSVADTGSRCSWR